MLHGLDASAMNKQLLTDPFNGNRKIFKTRALMIIMTTGSDWISMDSSYFIIIIVYIIHCCYRKTLFQNDQ